MEQLLPTVIAFVTGGSLTAVIVWLRFRKVDTATAAKSNAEAYSTIHTSDSNALLISAQLLATWMKAASEAEKELITLRNQMASCICKRGNGK